MAIGNNGGSNYLSRTANLPTIGNLTISGWWEFTQTTGTQAIYWAGGGSTDYVYVYQTGNQLKVEGKFGGGATLRSVTSTTTFSTGDIVWFGVRFSSGGTAQFYTSRGATVTSEGTMTWGSGSTNPTSACVLTRNSGSDLANGYCHGLKVHQGALDTYRITLEPNFGAFTHLPGTPCIGNWPMFSPTDVADVGGFDAGSWTVTGTLLQSSKSAPWSLAPSTPIAQRSNNYITGAGGVTSSEVVGSPTLTQSIVGAGAVATSDVEGTPTATLSLSGVGGVLTAEFSGSPTLAQTVTGVGGVVTSGSVGSPTVGFSISGVGGIATQENVGSPIVGLSISSAGAVATQQILGSLSLTEAISNVGGVTSLENVGVPTLSLASSQSISGAGGILSLENVGSPTANLALNRVGNVATGQVVGDPSLSFGPSQQYITGAGGITTAELLGLPIIWSEGGLYWTLANIIQSHFATRISQKLGIATQFDNAPIAPILELGPPPPDSGPPPTQSILECGNVASAENLGQPTAYLTTKSVGGIASAEVVGSPSVSLSGGPGFDTGTASISLKTPPSICWDRVTLRAYIGQTTTFYMMAVTFQYRVLGSSTWTSATPIYRCAHWRRANYYREITGLAQNTDYEFRCTVADISTGTLLNYSENSTQAVTTFRTKFASDATQFGNRKNTSGVTQATYALPGDPNSGLITQSNRRQFQSLIQRAGGTWPYDFVVFGTDNPSGKTAGTVWSYDINGSPNTAVVVTANSSTDVFSSGSMPLMNGQPVKFTTSGTLPTGISGSITYYVVNRTSTTCQVSTVIDGSALNFTSNGTGTLTMTVQAISYADHFMARSITALGLIGTQIGLEGFDGTRASYSGAEQTALDGTGGPNGTGYRPLYRASSSAGCCIGGANASPSNSDAMWSTSAVVLGISIVGADLTQTNKLAVNSSTDLDSFVAGDAAISTTFDTVGGGSTNIYFKNIKYGAVQGNASRIGTGIGLNAGTEYASQDTHQTDPAGLYGWKDCEFRAFEENWAGLSGTLSNEQGKGTKSHLKFFGQCRLDLDNCIASYTDEHWFYPEGLGTALTGVDDSWVLNCSGRPGMRWWSNPNAGFGRPAYQVTNRATPDAWKTSLQNGSSISSSFRTFHRALVFGQDLDATHSTQIDYVDGAPSEGNLWIEGGTIHGNIQQSTGNLTVNLGASTFTTASLAVTADMPIISIQSSGSLPAPLANDTTYFCVNITNGGKTFQLAARPSTMTGGTPVPITLTTVGSGNIICTTFENLGSGTNIDGTWPIAIYGGFHGTVHVTNFTCGRGVTMSFITNSVKGMYMTRGSDGKYYANGGVRVHSAQVASGVTKVYSNAMLEVDSCFDINVDSIDGHTLNRRTITLNGDLSDGKNGNANSAVGPTDDGFVLDENGQFQCGQSSGSSNWSGSQTKVEWKTGQSGTYAWTNPDVDASVAAKIIRDTTGTNPIGTFGNPS